MKRTEWKCPQCGSGEKTHGRGKCMNPDKKKPDKCHGFQCLCDYDEDSHGTDAEKPCTKARCFHCDWTGEFPSMNVGDIYKKLHMGDPLSDKELDFAIKTLEPTALTLRQLGLHFYLAWCRIDDDLRTLEGFRTVRKER